MLYTCIGAAGKVGPKIVLDFREDDIKMLKMQLNEFLIKSNKSLFHARKALLTDVGEKGKKITTVAEFKQYWTTKIKKFCDTEASAGTIVFDRDDGEERWAEKRDWTCEQLFSFKHSTEHVSSWLTSVCSTNDLFISVARY